MAKKPQNTNSLFIKRWNLTFNDASIFYQFKNRVIYVIEDVLGEHILYSSGLQNRYAYLLGEPAPIATTGEAYGIYSQSLIEIGGFRKTFLYQLFTNVENQIQLLWLLQNLFVLLQEGNYTDSRRERVEKLREFTLRIEKVFQETPQLVARLHKGKNEVFILPDGAKSLDGALVNDILDWLDDFPEVKKHYQEALRMKLENDPAKFRNLLDNLRLALELLLKSIMKNNQRLEEQAKPLKDWLVQNGVQESIRLMFTDLISRDRFTQLMNDAVKHGDRNWQAAEVEFLIYQIGVFFRFLIDLHQSSVSGRLVI